MVHAWLLCANDSAGLHRMWNTIAKGYSVRLPVLVGIDRACCVMASSATAWSGKLETVVLVLRVLS